MSRYSLRFADSDPFPPELELGVELQDEVIPPEPEPPVVCPECPECHDCEVDCKGWGYSLALSFSGFELATSGYARASLGNQTIGIRQNGRGMTGTYFPTGQFCGHKLRINATATGLTATTHYTATKIVEFDTGSEVGIVLAFTAIAPSGPTHFITLQAQIDLTDAAPGSETWTDLCIQIKVEVTAS